MDIDVIKILTLTGIPSAMTAFCFGLLKKHLDKKDRKREERERARERNEFLMMKCIGASFALGEATARAIKDGKCNGEMTSALDYAKKVKHEQKDFVQEIGIKNMY